jgi:hypothetical protein
MVHSPKENPVTHALLIAANLVAVSLLAFGLYFPRYRRKDITVAIVGLNVGVMAVATALSSSQVTAGLGLGLFGVLSIIRLRSSELDQEEVAYYFSALAMGLLAGFEITPLWLSPTLMAAIVLALFIGDHPLLFVRARHQTVVLDRAYSSESELVHALTALLDGDVLRVTVKKLDLVNDTTSVDVRFRVGQPDSTTQVPELERIERADRSAWTNR